MHRSMQMHRFAQTGRAAGKRPPQIICNYHKTASQKWAQRRYLQNKI